MGRPARLASWLARALRRLALRFLASIRAGRSIHVLADLSSVREDVVAAHRFRHGRASACCLLVWLCQRGSAGRRPSPGSNSRPGDHIAIIGNTLADRMQHVGWLRDAAPQPLSRARAGRPQPRLLRRRADRAAALGRLRHARRAADGGQGRRDLRLLRLQRIVRRRRKGWPSSSSDLDAFIKHTLGQKYNGKSPPRLVLFSPIAHEDLHDRNLPDGKENNAAARAVHGGDGRSRRRTTACRSSICSRPRWQLYAQIDAAADDQRRSSERAAATGSWPRSSTRRCSPAAAAGTRRRRSWRSCARRCSTRTSTWFDRYRTTDGYSIYGGRADLKFVDGQTNREVDAARDGSARRDDRQPRQARSGPSPQGERPDGRRQQHAAVHPGRSPTSPARCPAASTSSSAARKRSAR